MKLDINKWHSTKSFPAFDIKDLGYHNFRSEIKLFYIHPSGKTLQFKAGDDIDTNMSKASILQQSFGGVILYNTSEASFYEITNMISEYELEIFPDNLKEHLNINNEDLEYDVERKSDYEFDVKIFNQWLNNKYQITDPSTFYLSGKNFPTNDISDTKEQISDWIRDKIEYYYKDQYNLDITKRCVIIEPDRMIVSDSEFAFENYGLYMKKMFSSVIKANKLGSSNLILNIPDKPGKTIKSLPNSLYAELSQLDNNLLDTSSIKVPEQRKHQELYESQEWALEQLQKQGSGFQMLAGEVGVGKTHIASAYINDYLKDNPNAKILIVEPVKEVIPKFEQLINNLDNVTITDDVKQLNQGQWDVVLFDEMHKQNNKTVKDFPRKTKHYPDVVIGMTGTVSDMKPQEVYQITKNYEIKNIELHGGSVQTHLSSQSVLSKSPQTWHQQLMQYQQLPEAYVHNILKPVDLLRSDVKELNLESRMPVNKYQAGFDLSPKDKAFYNLLSMRAKLLNMDKSNQIDILDKVLNTNKSEIVIQPVKNFKTKKVQYELVDYQTQIESTHDLLYLGKRDTSFRDKKVDFIKQTINHVDGKVLLYLTSDNHQEHLMKDLQAEGIDVEYVNTNEAGAVQKINDSKAKVVAFNVLPIREGVDLKANTVMWYNTPQTAGIDEQACGRITRLTSSAEEKNIYYLYNKTTVQEQMVNEIIQTNNVNNMALKRDNDNIQQL